MYLSKVPYLARVLETWAPFLLFFRMEFCLLFFPEALCPCTYFITTGNHQQTSGIIMVMIDKIDQELIMSSARNRQGPLENYCIVELLCPLPTCSVCIIQYASSEWN